MTQEEQELLDRYGITVERKSVFTYKGHKYERLADAVNYAKIETNNRQRPDKAPA